MLDSYGRTLKEEQDVILDTQMIHIGAMRCKLVKIKELIVKPNDPKEIVLELTIKMPPESQQLPFLSIALGEPVSEKS